MKNIIIAPVGDYIDELYVGVKEIPTERVILIAEKEKLEKANEVKENLEKFKIPVQIKEIKGHPWEETFRIVAETKQIEKNPNIMINVSTGDRETRCAATSAAFVNGLKAFGIEDSNVLMLPVLKFSYYKLLTDKKMHLLKIIHTKKNCCTSLDQLSKEAGMSLPLISYHINGNLKSDGLKTLGLIETKDKKGRVEVSLSLLGRMLIKGYVK